MKQQLSDEDKKILEFLNRYKNHLIYRTKVRIKNWCNLSLIDNEEIFSELYLSCKNLIKKYNNKNSLTFYLGKFAVPHTVRNIRKKQHASLLHIPENVIIDKNINSDKANTYYKSLVFDEKNEDKLIENNYYEIDYNNLYWKEIKKIYYKNIKKMRETKLPDKYSLIVFYLYFIKGYSQTEIAKSFGVTRARIQQRVLKVKNDFKEMCKEYSTEKIIGVIT